MRFRFLFLIILCIAGCSKEDSGPVPETTSPSEAKPGELVLVTTNDFHAALDRAEGMASVIRALRKRYSDHMVYLDAGDQFQGSLEGNISKGEAVVEFYNLLKPDAVALGNHEFDYGPNVPNRVSVRPGEDGMGNLKERVSKAKYPILSSNLVDDPPVSCESGPLCNALGQKTVFPPHVVFERGGSKVCVIGGTTPVTKDITNPPFIAGKKFMDLAPVIIAESKMLREKEHCDWMLLCVHEGLRYERDGKTFRNIGLLPVMQQLPPGTVDAVAAGHSHTRLQEVIRGIPIMQTGLSGQNVGVLHLYRTGKTQNFRFDPFIPIPDTAVAFDVTSLLNPYRSMAFDYKRQGVGSTTALFPQIKTEESALGNLMADAILEAGKQQGGARFALINAGGIRSNLPAGRITYDNVFKLMPFDNYLVVAELTGAELRSLLQVAFSGALGMPSVSGLHITLLDVPSTKSGPWERDINQDGTKEEWERNVLIDARDQNGNPIDDKKMYKLATISFLSEGGDYQDIIYNHIPSSRIHVYGVTLIRDVFVGYFKAKSPLTPARYYSKAKPRIKLVELTPATAASSSHQKHPGTQ